MPALHSKRPVILLTWVRSHVLAVVRSLGGAVGRLVLLSGGEDPIIARSRHVDEFVAFDTQAPDDALVSLVLKIAERLPGARLIAGDERATRFLLRQGARLRESVQLPPLPPADAYQQATDKAAFSALLNRLGLPQPRTFAGSPAELAAGVDGAWQFPVMLKPTLGLGGVGIVHCPDKESLRTALDRIAGTAEPFLVQEWIPGPDVDCSFLARHGKIVAYTTQRAPAKAAGFAPATEIFLEDHPRLKRTMDELCAALHWSGVAHVDGVLDERDGQYRLLELNGRFWGSLLASTAAGVNFPLLLLDLMDGKAVTNPPWRPLRFYNGGFGLCRVLGRGGPRFRLRETDVPFVLKDPLPVLWAAARRYFP